MSSSFPAGVPRGDDQPVADDGGHRQASPQAGTDETALPAVTDEMLRDALQHIRPYTVCILKVGPSYQEPGPAREAWVAGLIWEHAKRNYALYLAGLMRIICPVGDGSGTTGVSIFDADPDEVGQIMRQDPAVKAGLFTYEIHPTQAFPESTLASSSAGDEIPKGGLIGDSGLIRQFAVTAARGNP